MCVYQTKEFARFARKERMGTKALLQAAPDAAQGHFHADLGGGVFKLVFPGKSGERSS
ncbi:MAG: type II toxin-antitoxin system RelE/ParE family toxin [Caulobacterales bacterium]